MKNLRFLIILVLLVFATGTQAVFADTGDIPMLFYGEASWYGDQFHGKQTASGEVYDMHMLSAAHRTLPFGTLLRITNLENDKSVTVRVNDRGPFVGDRVLDLSKAAASLLEFQDKGVAKIEARVVLIGGGRAAQVESGANTLGTAAAPQVTNTPANTTPLHTVPARTVQEQPFQANTPVAGQQPSQNEAVVGQAYGENPDPSKTAGAANTVRIIRPEDVRQPDGAQTTVQQPERTSAIGDSNGRFVIQAGAFLSIDNAEGLLRRYQSMGLPVYLRQLHGDHLQRVWVGPFASKADAEAQLERVRSLSERAYVCTRE